MGVTIGVVRGGVKRVFSYGAAKPDSIFEIGSTTKTFTGLMLAQMVAQGKAKLDERVRELLPPGTVAKPDGVEITLLDLATRRSGLPRFPSNVGAWPLLRILMRIIILLIFTHSCARTGLRRQRRWADWLIASRFRRAWAGVGGSRRDELPCVAQRRNCRATWA